MTAPRSCDTFVALPPCTANDCIVFGKNSDRPSDEVQEVIHVPAADHPAGSKLQCTYIEVDQVPHTFACVLSRPSWLWGAEMGANEHGVCIGNEAVWTKMGSRKDEEERLLGMDLVRLVLERSASSHEAVDILTSLIDQYSVGGPLYDSPTDSTDQPDSWSFIITDTTEVWVVETIGTDWAAEKITSGVRNISNQLTIRTKIDRMSDGLKQLAQNKGWWSPDEGEFDFAKVFSSDFEETELSEGDRPTSRQQWGTKLLRDLTHGGDFSEQAMFSILRHQDSGICMGGFGFASTGSQVSVLSPPNSNSPSCHWFTATSDPSISLFKPFIFSNESSLSIGNQTTSPTFGQADPAKTKPRFRTTVDRRHALWKAHEKLEKWVRSSEVKGEAVLEQMRQLEGHCVEDMREVMKNFDEQSSAKVAQVFKHMVDLEMNFYK